MELKRGATFAGEFIVEAILARDANAVVFVANQPSRNRLVTIKLFLTGDSGQRFLVTYARASQIKSDFVPKLFDLGTLPDGNSYVVREYIEGEDLKAVVSRGALTSMEAVQSAIQACDAVASTHAVGVVHGGLKTSSLILTRLPSGAPVVKVLNCGLVRIARSDSSVTPYRAPEQLEEGRKVDGRCDVWALGTILYELLTGEPPFTGSTPKSLTKRILTETPRPLRTIRPDIPEALEQVVQSCLERSPDARMASIADLATALSPFGSVHTIALPVRIAKLKIPPNILRATGGAAAPPSSRAGSANRADSSTIPVPPSSEPRPSTPLPLQMMAGMDEEPAVSVRKMTSEGRIVGLDADAAALVVREKRIAAEANNLAREARANPRPAPVEEDTGMRVLEEAARPAEPAPPPRGPTTQAKPWWTNLRKPVVLIFIGAIWAGLIVGLVVRIMANRPQPERRKPREIIVEDRPGGPINRSAP